MLAFLILVFRERAPENRLDIENLEVGWRLSPAHLLGLDGGIAKAHILSPLVIDDRLLEAMAAVDEVAHVE